MSVTYKTGKVRFSYVNLHRPRMNNLKGKEEFSCDVLIDKNDEEMLEEINAKIKEAYVEKFGTSKFKAWNNPLKDGDEKENEGYAGCMYITCTSDGTKPPPRVIGLKKLNGEFLPLKESEFYSGCYGRAIISFSGWTFENVKHGVGAYISAVQKTEEGEALGGGYVDVNSEFGDMAEETEEDDNGQF